MIYKRFRYLAAAWLIFAILLGIFFATRADASLIAQVVYEEARGESYTGQVAVAEVILNRVSDPWWPDTVEEVIYQDNQFALPRGKSDASTEQAAQQAVQGSDIVQGAQYFYNPAQCSPEWADEMEYVCTIDNHVFMRRPEGEETSRGDTWVLQIGSRGADVEAIQECLDKLGYSVEIDGAFGAETEAGFDGPGGRCVWGADGNGGCMVMENELTADKLFKCMCNTDVCVMNYISLISVPALACHFKATKYRVRKCMEELRSSGLVDSGCDSFYSDWHCQYFVVRGFYITDKGKKTDIYKKANEAEMKLIDEIFSEEAV